MKLIKEPEAAALFTIHSMGDKGLEVNHFVLMVRSDLTVLRLVMHSLSATQAGAQSILSPMRL